MKRSKPLVIPNGPPTLDGVTMFKAVGELFYETSKRLGPDEHVAMLACPDDHQLVFTQVPEPTDSCKTCGKALQEVCVVRGVRH